MAEPLAYNGLAGSLPTAWPTTGREKERKKEGEKDKEKREEEQDEEERKEGVGWLGLRRASWACRRLDRWLSRGWAVGQRRRRRR